MHLDWLTLLLGGLLIASISAFLVGVFPYPFGVLVLSVLLIARILSLKNSS